MLILNLNGYNLQIEPIADSRDLSAYISKIINSKLYTITIVIEDKISNLAVLRERLLTDDDIFTTISHCQRAIE